MPNDRVRLQLIGGPVLWVDDQPVAVPEGSKRLLVLVALRDRRLQRSVAARLLWPDVAGKRAAGNLRSAVWRIRGTGVPVFGDDPCWLVVDEGVAIDLEELLVRTCSSSAPISAAMAERSLPLAVSALDLLPGWYDDWLVPERERIRASLLGAIEAMTVALARAGRCADAIEGALTLVAQDPLRESGQAALIMAHLREDNICEARRVFTSYARMLRDELGVPPPDRLLRLVGAQVRHTPMRARRTTLVGPVPAGTASPGTASAGRTSAGTASARASASVR